MITGKMYDCLKFLALILLPALGTLYFALAGIWGLPSAEQVVGTIVAVDTFLGVLLHISSTNFNNVTAMGTLTIKENSAGTPVVGLELDGDPLEAIEGKSAAMFKIEKTPKVKPKARTKPKLHKT